MLIFWTLVLGAFIGYLIGYYVWPNRQLRKALQDAQQKCIAALEEGNKGVYRTIVTDNDKTSELVVEVKELAVTKNGQVKVQYLSAFYKNPDFRTRKGEALLKEVHGLLGEYLPLNEIEWYETTERHESIKKYLASIKNTHSNLLKE